MDARVARGAIVGGAVDATAILKTRAARETLSLLDYALQLLNSPH